MGIEDIMPWELCLKEHIKSIEPDIEKARALLKMASLRHEFWSSIKFDKKYTSIAVDGYYEVIKELLTALLYIEGYKSDNHECLISFLKKRYPKMEYEIGIIYQLKGIRNSIGYRGTIVRNEYLEHNKLEFEHIIKTLQNIIKEKLKEG
ncbi:MAG: hypothetical protein KJ955_08365 [Nanoarchaeota archaeon]|nr:hypothetical protein [Nanoarchaeota archaeon]